MQQSDAEHAKAIRKAVDALTAVIREAAADEIKVRLEIGAGTGFLRGADKTTRFPIVHAEIVRPL